MMKVNLKNIIDKLFCIHYLIHNKKGGQKKSSQLILRAFFVSCVLLLVNSFR